MICSKLSHRNAALSRRFLLVSGFLLLTACNQQPIDHTDLQLCSSADTPISAIQGSDAQSPLLNQQLTISGVVTHIEASGFFLQSAAESQDDDLSTSEALWVRTVEQPIADDKLGALLGVYGQVAELSSQNQQQTVTALIDAVWALCGQATTSPHQLSEALVNPEAIESMQVSVPAGWLAVDLYPLLSQRLRIASERLFIPTQVVSPGVPASQLLARNQQRSVYLDWSASKTSLSSRLRAGDRLDSITGVFDLRQSQSTVLAQHAPEVSRASKIPSAPQRDEAQLLRMVNINVQNLFNGNGQGGGFPGQRGAQTKAEYTQQLNRLTNAIDVLLPDVLALMELENDGYGDDSAIAQLTQALQQKTQHNWAYIKPNSEQLGKDIIAVGLLYRADRVKPISAPASMDTSPFDDLSRVPLAQRFMAINTDTSFLIAVNHFKSKGGCPKDNSDNSNQSDGQACWNAARISSAQVLSNWVKQLQQDWNEPNALIVGDLNSYRMEQPIRVLINAGWLDVAGQYLDPPLYSYRYFGEMGTLDYAFASQAMVQRIDDAYLWHINSDAAPNQILAAADIGIARFSDHDPVIVDIKR